MSILKAIFGKSDSFGPSLPDAQPVVCERLEKRRCDAHRAYHEEHLFGYIDAEGNVSSTPPEPGS